MAKTLVVKIGVLIALLSILASSCGQEQTEIPAAPTQQTQTAAEPGVPPAGEHTVPIDGHNLTLPRGFNIERWVAGRGDLRMMAVTDDGYLLVTEKDEGNVLAFSLADQRPQAVTVIEDLSTPSGIAYHDKHLWVAEVTSVSRYEYLGGGRVAGRETVISGIPSGGHSTRTIGFGPDNRLYVAVGSSCNVCEEEDPRRGAISRYNQDGSGEILFAAGLRNTVGFVWHPVTGEMWGVDNGRDRLGDNLPPEEINIIREGRHYGWPYCYGNRVVDPFGEQTGKSDFCPSTEPPIVEMQAHSAPLGLRFLESTAWPQQYRGSLFIAFHGSWNRTVPTGYKVVRVGEDRRVTDFITGWMDQTGVWGRPVDILFVGQDMYITDDYSGSIYRVTLEAE